MGTKVNKRLPKILKINRIEKSKLKISVLFSNGENRIIDFHRVFRNEWKITKSDPEFKLLSPVEFAKVKLANYTLSWNNVALQITGLDGKKKKVPYEIGADVLYTLSEPDHRRKLSVGTLLKEARIKARLSQEELAVLSGTSRTYITRLENDKQDVEIMTLKKIVEAGLNKQLSISIE